MSSQTERRTHRPLSNALSKAAFAATVAGSTIGTIAVQSNAVPIVYAARSTADEMVVLTQNVGPAVAQPGPTTKRGSVMAKLSLLKSLKRGWDHPDSAPLNLNSENHFRDFLTFVRDDRLEDAEPILTDDGFIRLEWDAAGYSYTAEIGADSLYLCALAPVSADDRDVELDHFDQIRLLDFFHHGKLG